MVVFSVNRLLPAEVFGVTEYTTAWPFRGPCGTLYSRMISLRILLTGQHSFPPLPINILTGIWRLDPGLREKF